MHQFYASMALIGAVAFVLALLTHALKARIWWASAPLLAMAAGVVLGPDVLGWLRPKEWGAPHGILLEVARIAIAMAAMSIALRVPGGFWRGYPGTMALVLTVGMLAMWVASALLSWWLLPVGFATALLVGAVLTPTDPVIAGSITTGTIARHLVPSRVRFALAAESGANDGAAYAFVTLPLMALLEHGPSSWDTWVMDGLLRGVLLACVIGFAIGALAGGLQRLAEKAWWAEATTLRALPIALALLTLGALKLVGSDGILGVFLAGVAFNVVVARGGERDRQQEERQEQVQEMVNNLVSWPAFLVFGTLLPWSAWSDHLTALVLFSLAILLLRRPPWFYLLERPLTRRAGGAADRLFLGWFGPIGMAAIFYALHARGHHQPEVWVYASFVVVASVVVHGVTATPGTKWYGRRAGEPERRAEDG